MSLVKSALAIAESQFISVYDVLTRICEVDDCTCQEAATLLHRLLLPFQSEEDELWKRRGIDGIHYVSSYAIPFGMDTLRRIAENGMQKRVYGISNYNDELYGLDGNKVYFMLKEHGIDIGSIQMPTNDWPQWKYQMALMPLLNIRETASAFADIDLNLEKYGFISNDDKNELNRHMDIITRNIEAGRIKVTSSTAENPIDWRFTPEALAEWCATQGIHYPLPKIAQLPSTDEELRQAFSHARIENARLKDRIAALENENAKLQASPEPLPDYADTRKSKGKRQEAAVLYWVVFKKFNPKSIPDGGKATLQDMCEKSDETKDLFEAKSAFEETWKRLRKTESVRLENHASYTNE